MSRGRADPGPAEGGRLPLGDPLGHDRRHRRRHHPAGEGRDPGSVTRSQAERVEKAYQRGNLSHAERNDDLVKIWEAATKEIEEAIPAAYPKDNPVYTLVAAGAAGNWIQVRSLAGMKGVVANSKGQQIPRPIRSSFREGLSVLEYFINTHSARKGLADTALRTAESGYLTRRLVDVSQDVIVRETDCGTERGVDLPMADRYADGSAAHQRVHRDLGAGPGSRGRPGRRRRHRRRAARAPTCASSTSGRRSTRASPPPRCVRC